MGKRARTGCVYDHRVRNARRARAVLKQQRAVVRKRYPSYLTCGEAARRYRKTLRTVQRWVASGVECKRVKGVILLDPRAVERYLIYRVRC